MIDDPLFDIPVVLKVKGTKGDKGERGDTGRNGVDGKDGANGENGINGKDGKNGRDGLDGKVGKDGIDGKSAYQLWLSLGNKGSVEDFILSLRGDDGLSAYDIWLNNGYSGKEEDFLTWLKGKDGVSTYQNVGMSVPDIAGQVGRLKLKGSVLDTDNLMIARAGSLFRISVDSLVGTLGFVPYTGATQDVNLGTHSLITHSVKSDATDGLILESANGTDVGILGAANTANVSWYGNHNFNNQTADTVAGFSSSKTLSSLALSDGITVSTNTVGLGDITPTSVDTGSIAAVNGTIGTLVLNADPLDEHYGGTGQLGGYVKGDMLAASATNTLSIVSGNASTTKKFLSQTGDGSFSELPVWDAITGTSLTGFTDTQIPYGNSSGGLSSEAAFTYTATTNKLKVDNLVLSNGAVGTPSLTLDTSDTNTGLYWLASDQLGITSGGVQVGHFLSAGVRIGITTNRLAVAAGLGVGEKGLEIGYGATVADKVTIQGLHQGTAYRDILINPDGGNVSIGTSSTSEKLRISGSLGLYNGSIPYFTAIQSSNNPTIGVGSSSASSNTLRFTGSTTSPGYIAFSDGTDSGLILYHHNGDYFQFNTGGVTRQKIDVNGAVFTAAPTAILDNTRNVELLCGVGEFASLGFRRGTDGLGAKIAMERTGSGTALHFLTSNSFATGITTNVCSMMYDGKVGFGLTPTYNLQAQATTYTGQIQSSSNDVETSWNIFSKGTNTNGRSTIRLENNDTTGGGGTVRNTTYLTANSTNVTKIGTNGLNNSTQFYTAGNYALQLGTNNTARCTILGSGELGIGTNAPRTLVEVFGSSTPTVAVTNSGYKGSNRQANVDFYSGGDVTERAAPICRISSIETYAATLSYTGDLSFQVASASAGGMAEGLRIASTRTVAIGTSTPASGTMLTLQPVHSSIYYMTSTSGTLTATNDGTSSGVQCGWFNTNTFNPTNGASLVYQLYLSGIFKAPSTKTITDSHGIYIYNDPSSNVGTLTNVYGIRIVAGASAAGTVTNHYGLHVKQPAGGTNKYTAYFDAGVGIAQVNAGSTHALLVTGTAGLSTGTAWTNTSDKRIKKNVKNVENALPLIEKLQPRKFEYINEYLESHKLENKEYYGFIADEVEQVIPSCVRNSKEKLGDIENLKQFDIHNMNILLIKAVQELLVKVNDLEAQILKLKPSNTRNKKWKKL